MKFVCDRMLKRLAIWLRLSGYDTLCDESFQTREREDTFLAKNFPDRILLTRDKELYRMRIAKGYPARLIKSSKVWEQMKEIRDLVNFKPKAERCTLCNSRLRKLEKAEAEKIVKELGLNDLLNKELWYCDKCKKLYWVGYHWKNMLEFLKKHGLVEEGKLRGLNES